MRDTQIPLISIGWPKMASLAVIPISSQKKAFAMKTEACLVLVNVPRSQWCFRITEKQQTIGRSPESSIEIPHYYRSVSRRHALAWYQRGTFRISDVGS